MKKKVEGLERRLAEDPTHSVPSPQRLITTYNSSSRGSDSLLWPPWAPVMLMVHRHTLG